MQISNYIKTNKILSELDFMTVYATIITLMKDGYINVGKV